MKIIATCGMEEAPPSSWHGLAGFYPRTNKVLYAIVPLNVLIWYLRQLWFLITNPGFVWRFLYLDKDSDRLRRVERELRCVERACHSHRLIWTGKYLMTYEQAEAEAKANRENPPRTLGPPPYPENP